MNIFNRGMMRLMFTLIVAVMVSVLLLFNINQEVYTVNRILPMKMIDDSENNVTIYIQRRKHDLQNSAKSEKEMKDLQEYMADRVKIIKMLPRITKQSFRTTFHVLVEKTRKLVGQRYELMILVLSFALNFERRRNIRELWGNKSLSANKDWTLIFVTGGVNDRPGMENLYQEAIRERDVIILDFMENYAFNLPKKDMAGIQWANANYNYDYILKCDDDLFIDIDSLIAVLRTKTQRLVYIGTLMEGSPVLRSGRYGVSIEEYPADVYEPYCSGGAFVLSRHLVERMIPHFQWEHPLRIEDAYMGGRVIKAGGRAVSQKGFDMWNDDCKYFHDLLATHPADKNCMKKLQKIVLENKRAYISE